VFLAERQQEEWQKQIRRTRKCKTRVYSEESKSKRW